MPTATLVQFPASAPSVLAESAWISPYGTFYAVDEGKHWDFAESMLPDTDYSENGDAVSDLERAGWVHVSGMNLINRRVNATQSQISTLMDWTICFGEVGDTWNADTIMQWCRELDR